MASINYHEILGGAQPDWEAYKKAVAVYLARQAFAGTPLTADMLTNAAQRTYLNTGNYVPYDLALAQAQFESSMGREGRNPKTNPFNVGEFDKGTKQRFRSTQEGVDAYFNLMANDYLKISTRDDLLKNFVNYRGSRYASNPQYEKNLGRQSQRIMEYVAPWVNK